MGEAGQTVDVELLKQNVNIETDAVNNILLWHVPNLHENESAVLSFASKALDFEGMFPLNITFNEQYSVIDLQIDSPKDLNSGEEMSQKTSVVLQTEGYKITSE
jgi:hypothetical protein